MKKNRIKKQQQHAKQAVQAKVVHRRLFPVALSDLSRRGTSIAVTCSALTTVGSLIPIPVHNNASLKMNNECGELAFPGMGVLVNDKREKREKRIPGGDKRSVHERSL